MQREKRHVGYVDLGGELKINAHKIAKNALVLMAVGLKKYRRANSNFYFTAGINAETSLLINQSINALNEIGMHTTCTLTNGLRNSLAALKNIEVATSRIGNSTLQVDLVKRFIIRQSKFT